MIFMIVAITVVTASVAIILTNSQGAALLEDAAGSHTSAESGIENALLRLLRNPGYTGETMQINSDQIVITVTGSNPYIITSTATTGKSRRSIEAKAEYINNELKISQWKEI